MATAEQQREVRRRKRERENLSPRVYINTPAARQRIVDLVNSNDLMWLQDLSRELAIRYQTILDMVKHIESEGLVVKGRGWVATAERAKRPVYPKNWLNGNCHRGHSIEKYATQRLGTVGMKWCCRECDRLQGSDARSRKAREGLPLGLTPGALASAKRAEGAVERAEPRKSPIEMKSKREYKLVCGDTVYYRDPVMLHEELWCVRCDKWKPQLLGLGVKKPSRHLRPFRKALAQQLRDIQPTAPTPSLESRNFQSTSEVNGSSWATLSSTPAAPAHPCG